MGSSSPGSDNSMTWRICLVAMTVALAMLAVVYHVRGYYYLTAPSEDAIDLRNLWEAQQSILQGHTAAANRAFAAQHESNRQQFAEAPFASDLRTRMPLGGYPPWCFLLGTALFWPSDWSVARWYFAGIDFVLIAGISVWTWRANRRDCMDQAWLLVAAVLAMNSICNTLVIGQYGIVILACLVATLWLYGRDQRVASGVMLGLALAKPTLSIPFVVPFLVKREWRVLVACGAYLGLATAVAWWMTDANLIEMVLTKVKNAPGYAGRGDDPLSLAVQFGLDPAWAMSSIALISISVGTLVIWKWRKGDLLILFAIAGVVARLWTYHKKYDNLILMFLLVALGVHAVKQKDKVLGYAFLLTGFSLWAPSRLVVLPAFPWFQMVTWIVCLCVLLLRVGRDRRDIEADDTCGRESSAATPSLLSSEAK